MAISDKLMRRDRRAVSALEIIVSNLDVQHRVKFCATCFQNAIEQSQSLPQPQIQLCPVCLERRDQHISTVHARQSSLHEAWENDVTQMPVCYHEHDPVQYAYDFDNAIEKISGRRWGLKGGMPWSDVGVKIVAPATVSLVALIAGCTLKETKSKDKADLAIATQNAQTAREALEETKRSNRNNEIIAMQNAQNAIRNSEITRQTSEETKRKNAFEAVSTTGLAVAEKEKDCNTDSHVKFMNWLIGQDAQELRDFMGLWAARPVES